MISDTLALAQFFLTRIDESKTKREPLESESLLSTQLSQALSHEIRCALHLVELASSAHEKRDSSLRNHLVRSIELPLLQSIARGMFSGDLSPAEREKLRKSIPLDAEDSAEMMGEVPMREEEDDSARSSRLVARVESMKILASHLQEIPWIRWPLRLGRVKRELIGMLSSIASSSEKSEAALAGQGV